MQLDRHLGNATASHWLGLAIAPLVSTLIAAPSFAATPPIPVLTDYSILNHVTVNDLTAPAVQSPPVNGFVAQVAVGLTSQRDNPNNLNYFAEEASATAGSQPSPLTNPPKYVIATLDTGAESHIISVGDRTALGIDSHLDGNTSEILGASGTETCDITNALGIYVTGLSNATNSGGSIALTGTLKGQTNTAILAASDPNSVLPNLVGAPLLANYQVAITNSNPQTLTVGATTYHSPNVTFTSLSSNPPLPSNFYRMTLDLSFPLSAAGGGASPDAAFLPDYLTGGSSFSDPGTPSFWGSMLANVSGSQGGNAVPVNQFLFDTGSQVTVFSEDTAAQYGFFTGGPHQSTPAFTVAVEGVGGTIQVPGFYVDQLKVLTNGGYITWNHVPVLVLDLPDARDGIGFMPGVLGMNLFTDRDLVINGGLDNPAVSFSEQMQWYVNGPGLWSESAKWMLGTPNSVNRPAQFLAQITSPQTITVDGNYTVGSLIFDNTNRYTLNVINNGRITVQTTDDVGDGAISVFSGSHTINVPITLANATTINIAQATSKLTITNDVTATGIPITKTGDGTVEMKNIRADSLALGAGTVSILASGANTSTSVLNTITSTGGKLDLQNNKLIVKGSASGGTATLGSWNGTAYTGITGLLATGRNGGTAPGNWDGPGIVTSQTSAGPTKQLTTLAVATADQLTRVGQSFGGQPLATGDVLVMYTYAGDANLSGNITGDDYFQIDQGFASHGSLTGYFNGDFNYDGKINADDYFLIDRNYSAQTSTFSSDNALGADSVAPVPEPTSLALLALSAAMISQRRRR